MALALANPAEEADPFADIPSLDPAPATATIIGGATPAAPAYQTVAGKTTEVPKAIAATLTSDLGPFSDLVDVTNPPPIDNYAEQFGMFSDLVPWSPTPEMDKALVEFNPRHEEIGPTPTDTSGFVKGERPPFAGTIAGWIDKFTEAVFGKPEPGAITLSGLVEESTREPRPGEPSFTNLGIPPVPQQTGKAAQIGAGLANIPIGFANFLLAPGGIASLQALGMAPKLAQTLVGAGFTVEQANEFVNAKTMQDKISSGVGTLLLGLGTAHGVSAKTAADAPVSPATAPEAAPVTLEQRLPVAQAEPPAVSGEPTISQPSEMTEVQKARAALAEELHVYGESPMADAIRQYIRKQGGGEQTDATQEGQIAEGNQPEHPGNAPLRPSAEAGGGGSNAPGGEAQAPEVTTGYKPGQLIEYRAGDQWIPAQVFEGMNKLTGKPQEPVVTVGGSQFADGKPRTFVKTTLPAPYDAIAIEQVRPRQPEISTTAQPAPEGGESSPTQPGPVSIPAPVLDPLFADIHDAARKAAISDNPATDISGGRKPTPPPGQPGSEIRRQWDLAYNEQAQKQFAAQSETSRRAPSPTLRPGEKQGDLLSTQTEDLKLVGEKGTDFAARQDQAAQEEQARRVYEAEMQRELADVTAQQGPELLDAIRSAGGLPSVTSKIAPEYAGELSALRESVKGVLATAKRGEGAQYRGLFGPEGKHPDKIAEALREQGFTFDGPNDLLDAVDMRLRTKKPVHAIAASSETVGYEGNDWTQATAGIVAPGTAELQRAGEAVARAVKSGAAAATQLKPFTDFRAARLKWSARNQASTGELTRAAREIKRAVPNAARREGITNWIQAGGDLAELQRRAVATKNLQLRPGYEAAQKLTPEEKAIAGKIRQTYEILRQRAEANGIEIARLEDYVNQIWKRPMLRDFFPSSTRRLSTNVRFARQRFHQSFFHGEQAGLKPETKDIAKLLPIYMNEVNNAISAKQFVAEMSAGKASDGRPLLAPRGGGTVIDPTEGQKGVILAFPDKATADTLDYKPLNQPALHQWKWVGEENGKPILLKGDLAVHPEAYNHLKNVLGQSAIREWYRAPSETALGAIPKAATKILVDDVQQIGKATMLGFLSPFHQVQEGTHAVGHRVNPFGGLEKIDLSKPNQIDAASHGLMLLPDRVSAQQFKEGLDGSTRNLLANVLGKAGGKPGRMVKEWSDGYQQYLFHQYIPALKLKTYEHILERNNARYAKELASGNVRPEQVKFLSAEQSNAAYGHLNYADLGRNPTLQHIAQTFLLAPDFLEARTRFAGQAAAGVFSKVGREQFAAIGTLAATQWILARVLNKTLDDDYHFDEPFGVIVGNRRYTMRSVPEDIYKAFHDSRRFITGRLSPILGRGLLEGLSGVNYRSEPTTIGETLTNIIGGMVPISVQPMTRGLTETGRDNPVSPFEQLLGSLGLHVSRFSPVSKVYSLSKDWVNEHGKEFGIQPEKGIYPVSKYQQLRYALEDGDFERAKVERQKLIDAGEKPEKVTTGFRQSINHPFTGSQLNDRRFKKSLSLEDQKAYDAAVKRRRLILERYGMILK